MPSAFNSHQHCFGSGAAGGVVGTGAADGDGGVMMYWGMRVWTIVGGGTACCDVFFVAIVWKRSTKCNSSWSMVSMMIGLPASLDDSSRAAITTCSTGESAGLVIC